jgi:hypothetical protein
MELRVKKIMVLDLMIRFIDPSSLNDKSSSAIVDLHTSQFAAAHALGFSVSTSRILSTDLHTSTITSNHSEVFLWFLIQSPWTADSLNSDLRRLNLPVLSPVWSSLATHSRYIISGRAMENTSIAQQRMSYCHARLTIKLFTARCIAMSTARTHREHCCCCAFVSMCLLRCCLEKGSVCHNSFKAVTRRGLHRKHFCCQNACLLARCPARGMERTT